jgi:phage gp36-like protein
MGRYITDADIAPSLVATASLVFLTNDDADAVVVDSDVLDTLIGDAESEVDGYVGFRYALPLSSIPNLVKRLSARVARYRLYTRRPGSPEEWLQKDYDNAIAQLERIRDGKLSLGLTEAGADPAAGFDGGTAVQSTSRERIFGRANTEGY